MTHDQIIAGLSTATLTAAERVWADNLAKRRDEGKQITGREWERAEALVKSRA